MYKKYKKDDTFGPRHPLNSPLRPSPLRTRSSFCKFNRTGGGSIAYFIAQNRAPYQKPHSL